ncbi:MAG: hypothetical protein RR697_03645, partial [Malacoplasma sp.]
MMKKECSNYFNLFSARNGRNYNHYCYSLVLLTGGTKNDTIVVPVAPTPSKKYFKCLLDYEYVETVSTKVIYVANYNEISKYLTQVLISFDPSWIYYDFYSPVVESISNIQMQ